MMTLLIPVLFFSLLNGAMMKLIKQRFGFCIPLTLMTSSFVLYFSQMMFHTFTAGFWLLVIIAVAMLVDQAVNRKKGTGSAIFLAGFTMFILIAILYFIIDYDHRFQSFDEFYHWGTMVKESLRLDRFYCVQASNLWIHKDYPPFMCLFEVLWCKLCNGYSEPNVLRAIHVFNLSIILCPLVEIIHGREEIKRNGIAQETVLFFLTLIVILLFDPWGFRVSTTIMTDITTPLLFVYGFMVVHNHKDEDFSAYEILSWVLANAALLMTKQVGMAFVMLMDLYVLMTRIIYWKKSHAVSLIGVGKYMILCLLPLLIYATWGLYIKSLSVQGQFGLSSLSIREYASSFYGHGLRHDTLVHFFHALFTVNITTIRWIPMSYFLCFVLVTAALLFLYRTEKLNKKSLMGIGIVFVCGTIGYALLMSVLYLFSFNTAEMIALASYDRYMSSYVLAEIMILYLLFMEDTSILKTGASPASTLKLISACLILLCFNPSNVMYIIPQATRGNAKAKYESDARLVADRTQTKARVFVVYNKEKTDQNWWGAYQAYLQYYLNDRSISHAYVNAYEIHWNSGNKSELETAIEANDYLYVKDTNSHLNSIIKQDYGITLKQNSVYKVVKQGKRYRLISQHGAHSLIRIDQ